MLVATWPTVAHVGDYEDRFFRNVRLAYGDALEQLAEKKEQYVRAWIAETGLHPSECELVVMPVEGGGTSYRMQVRRRTYPG
jgi:hypothetical protein